MSAEGRQDVAERLSVKRLTVDGSAGLVHQAVAFQDAVGLLGLAPRHVDRRGGEFTEVDEAGSAGRFGMNKEKIYGLYMESTVVLLRAENRPVPIEVGGGSR